MAPQPAGFLTIEKGKVTEMPPKPDQTPQPRRVPQQYAPAVRQPPERWGDIPIGIKAIEHNPEVMNTIYAPTPYESYPIMKGAGSKLEMMAAPAVAGPAGVASRIAGMIIPVLDYIGGGTAGPAFGKAYGAVMKGRETEMKIQKDRMEMQREYYEQQRQRMIDSAQDSRVAHQAMLLEYERVFSLYKNNLIDEKQAEQMVEELNLKHNHQHLNGRLHNAGLKAVENYLMDEHAYMVDMWNAQESLTQSDRRRRKDAGLDPDTDLDKDWLEGGGRSRTRPGERPLPMHGDAEKEAEAAKPPDPDKPVPGSDEEEVAKKYHLSASGRRAMHEQLEKGEIPGMTPAQLMKKGTGAPEAYPAIVSAANELRGRINDIAANRTMPTEEKLERIRQISPEIADTAQGLLDYRLNPDTLPSKTKGMLTQLANQLSNGGYNQGMYKLAQKYLDPNTREGAIVDRTSTLPAAMLGVLKALKPLSETDKIPKKFWDQLKSDHYTGDDKYRNLYSALRIFAFDAVGIALGGAKPAVTSVNDFLAHMTPTSSPAQIRSQVVTDVSTAYATLQSVNNRWSTDIRKPGALAPGITAENMDRFDAFLRMNPHTGEMPADADDTLKAVGKPHPGDKERPSWMTEKEAASPLTRKQVNQWRAWLKEHPDDPNAQLIREQLMIVP